MNETLKHDSISSVRQAAWRFIGKVLLFSLPFWIVALLYLYDDPFMVLRDYEVYDSPVLLNEAHVGWKIYLNNRDTVPFNSFLMGNSSTMAFRCREWEKYLDGGRAIRLYGNAETMMAIYRKLSALEREHARIDHVLMILDKSSLSEARLRTGFRNLLPPALSGQSPLSVQLEFLQGFLTPAFLPDYLRYRLTGSITSSMDAFNPHGRLRDPVNNDAFNPRDRLIAAEGERYWSNRPNDFPQRSRYERVAPQVIFGTQEELLTQIADLLRRHATSVKIVISPDYKQERLYPQDRRILQRLFGEENVFDFSGVNEYTSDIHHYYERGHYRPLLGNRLLKRIYDGN